MNAQPLRNNTALLLIISLLFVGSFSFVPQRANAFEWGGQFQMVIPCWNAVIYAVAGPPRGGPFIWTPATATYSYGPPSHTGQYGLGLAGPPYFCIVSPFPIIVFSGIIITMMGSSR